MQPCWPPILSRQDQTASVKWCSGWQWRHHIGWSLSRRFLIPISALPPSEGLPEGSPHPAQYLRGRYPDPSQRGHSSPSCRKHSVAFTDSCAARAKLISITEPPLALRGPGLGVLAHRRGHSSLSDIFIIPYVYLLYTVRLLFVVKWLNTSDNGR